MRSFCEALRRLNWFHCALLGRCALPSFFYRVLLLSRRGKGTGPEYLAGRAPSLFSGKNSVKKKAKNQKSNAVARSSDEATEIKATNEERDRRSRFIGVFFVYDFCCSFYWRRCASLWLSPFVFLSGGGTCPVSANQRRPPRPFTVTTRSP